MTTAFDTFRASLAADHPPADIAPLAQAVWLGLQGRWDAAHEIAQADDSRDGARIHAWLHRIEGDRSNAQYWYGRAGHPPSNGTVREEGLAIAAGLLDGHVGDRTVD